MSCSIYLCYIECCREQRRSISGPDHCRSPYGCGAARYGSVAGRTFVVCDAQPRLRTAVGGALMPIVLLLLIVVGVVWWVRSRKANKNARLSVETDPGLPSL